MEAQSKIKKGKKKHKTEVPAPTPKKDKKKTIKDLTKSSKKIEGLFTMYQDTITGSLQMVLSENQINKEFIYFIQTVDAPGDLGFAGRGIYGKSKVFKIQKYFNKIEFITQNTSFYFDESKAIANAKEANISNGNMASLKVEAHDKKDGLYLIKADGLFLKEVFSQIKPPSRPGGSPTAFKLGNLDKEKTKIIAINNYPKNIDLVIEYIYSKPSTINGGSNAVVDGRNVSIKVNHSLIEMPDNDYEIKLDDPRVGFFTTQVDDKTSMSSAPYRDLVHRWHLKKKDPNTAISEPVTPITWWMENTTPKEIRPIIKKAGEQWNIAFEKAGFKNAIVIKQQPDDAEWDAGDIRYNVLRWTSSPQTRFGGYGPSFVNPRTGQILGADIMIEYAVLAGSLRGEKLFEKAALNTYYEEMTEFINTDNHDIYCAAGQMAQLDNMFGTIANTVFDEDGIEKSKMVNQFLHFLILHEMGHTLGLNHNMKSSQLHSISDINNEDITSEIGLMGSVMDYPAINYNNDRDNQGQYWTMRPGPYDIWAIQFGYQPMSEIETKALLSKSTQPELVFGNDADDMRSPGKAIDPLVNVNDLTNDAIQYAINRINLSNEVAKEVLAKYKVQEKGNSYQLLGNSYFVLTGQQAAAANTISRYIGGIYIDRGMVGQKGATKPYTPVSLQDQKRAMTALGKYVFSSNSFSAPKELYNYLAPQRRGFNLRSKNEDPKIHDRVLGIQKSVLMHLLHPNTLQRITDSGLYGNKYTLSAFMTDLNNAIFKSDIYSNVNSFRQNLQLEYTNMLIDMVTGKQTSKFTHNSKSMALYNLKAIRAMAAPSGNIASRAHKQHLRTLIDNAVKEIK
ncbi:zinc-dependent metalloprotease [Algibacter agarivorans]|uniref:Zinc-dependent metalloprotease n=1 Tax=Algibacter agarivorans TaxID=1109741 RepID=A0ABP9GIY4_9FLAO